MFRLKIDFPLGEDEKIAIDDANSIINWLVEKAKQDSNNPVGNLLQYLLSNDEDRSVRNYLNKDKHGHASTKKSKLHIG
jgi:hypothetical protein